MSEGKKGLNIFITFHMSNETKVPVYHPVKTDSNLDVNNNKIIILDILCYYL